MRDSLPSILDLKLHGQKIAELHHLGGDRTIFTFTPDYIEQHRRYRHTLSLSFQDPLGNVANDNGGYQTHVMPFLSNLLPEGVLRDYIAKQAGIHADREFYMLWLLGMDLPGALVLEPQDSNESSYSLANAMDGAVTESPANVIDDYAPIRFSLAGVQLKLSAYEQQEQRITIPANGLGGNWIIKPPHSNYKEIAENEFSMMEMARKLGMDVPRTMLIPVKNIENIPKSLLTKEGNAYAVERFDRNGDQRVHMEDFAQVFGVFPKDKYAKVSMRNIASVVAATCPQQDTVELVRRIVFNVLIGNGDMHLKNWSLLYKDKVHPSLAPAYDFLSTVPYSQDTTSALKLCNTKNFALFTYAELSNLAFKAMLPESLVIDTAKDTVERFHELWDQEKHHLPLSKALVKAIDTHLRTIPLR